MIFTVPLWGSEVANSKTEIHLTNTAVEVGMQRHIYAMSLLLIYVMYDDGGQTGHGYGA